MKRPCKSSNPANRDSRNRWRDFVLRRSRGEPLCTFVTEIIGLPLALTVFPQVYDFPGDAVLQLVQPGLYKKGWHTNHSTA